MNQTHNMAKHARKPRLTKTRKTTTNSQGQQVACGNYIFE
jgi:hypothetical protein